MWLKIGNFLRSLCASEIEEKGPPDDLHFNGAQIFIRADQFRHFMSENLIDSPGLKNLVNFVLALESVEPVEEFDRGEPIRSQDKSVLPRSRAEISEQSAGVP